jgi:hypothetical protein
MRLHVCRMKQFWLSLCKVPHRLEIWESRKKLRGTSPLVLKKYVTEMDSEDTGSASLSASFICFMSWPS